MKNSNAISRLTYIIICLVFAFAACRPAKKVQRIGAVIATKDTAGTAKAVPDAVDSSSIIKNIVNTVSTQRISFNTFSAKVKMDYDGSEGNGQATVYLRMQKDSVIWLSLTGAFGIEGFRVLITKDSVKLMNKLDKVVQYKSIAYLQDLTHVPVNFYDMQDILIGNPVYLDSNIVSYKYNEDNLLVLVSGSIFKNLLTLDKNNLRILHSKLDDVEPSRNRTADFTFDKYDKVNAFYFSSQRKISVAEKARLDINLEFKQYNFDEPESFPFNVPKSYKSR